MCMYVSMYICDNGRNDSEIWINLKWQVVNHQLLKVYERKLEEMKRQNMMTMGDDELYKILA